ncbi:MAG: type IV secretory system conjugative DNA transfer family protein, partial [Hylemonella sp.]
GRSRSFSSHGHSSVSSNESEQRRALLLPQEFKELGAERLVVIVENCKPVLGEKIRYYRDKAFRSRLLPAPDVPQMDVDLHLARVQQRWRYADGELGPGETIEAQRLNCDLSLLPDQLDGTPDQVAETVMNFLTGDSSSGAGMNNSIEPVADEDGVLMADPATPDRADIT